MQFWQPTRGILQPNQHWRRGTYAPPVGTLVYDISGATFTNDSGWSGYTLVFLVPAVLMGAASGTKMSVTVQFFTALAGTATMIGYVGQKAASGDVYDFAGTPSQFTWGGNTIYTGNASTLVLDSDLVTLPQAYDETKDYLFSFYFGGTGQVSLGKGGASTGLASYYKASTNEAALADKTTGYSSWNANTQFFVQQVRVN